MKRLLFAALFAVTVFASSLLTAAPASAASQCTGTSGYWTCVSTSSVVYHTSVTDTVPLINASKYTATMHCSFTSTVTRSWSVSISLTASVKASVWGVAEASISGTQTQTLTMTGSQATTAGGSVVLPPGGSVICQRIYGYYSVATKVERWSNYKVVSTQNLTTNVPYHFGVKLV
jgi:hypothetical protein